MSLTTILGRRTQTKKRKRNGTAGRSKPEPIALLARKYNYFPKRFRWRGRKYDIYAIQMA